MVRYTICGANREIDRYSDEDNAYLTTLFGFTFHSIISVRGTCLAATVRPRGWRMRAISALPTPEAVRRLRLPRPDGASSGDQPELTAHARAAGPPFTKNKEVPFELHDPLVRGTRHTTRECCTCSTSVAEIATSWRLGPADFNFNFLSSGAKVSSGGSSSCEASMIATSVHIQPNA